MSTNTTRTRRNTAMVAALAAAAALAGGVGVAAAASGPSGGAPVTTQAEGSEPADGPERKDGTEQEDLAVNGSIQVEEQAGENERQEAAQLAALATVSQAEAEQVTLTAIPGTVTSAALSDEDGSLIWEVLVRRPDGAMVEAEVDAGNGTVLAQEADDNGVEGTSEQDEAEEDDAGQQNEAGEAVTE